MNRLQGERVYLAGPMTGFPLANATAFAEAAERLRAANANVYVAGTGSVADDMEALLAADEVILLPGAREALVPELTVADHLGIPYRELTERQATA